MRLDEALYSRLSGFAGLIALVPADRIYPQWLSQAPVYPAVTFTRISTERFQHFSGNPDHEQTTVQVSAWGATFTSARQVADQIYAALQGFVGVMGGAGGVQVGSCLAENELELTAEVAPDKIIHHIAVDFVIVFAR